MATKLEEKGAWPAWTGLFVTKNYHHTPSPYLDPQKVSLPKPFCVAVTGGGRGLGEAYAVGFTKAGATDIVITARSTSELEAVSRRLKEINPQVKVSVVTCDVTSEDDVAKLGETIQSNHGRLDVLINNAGYLESTGWKPLTDSSPLEWRQTFDVNVFGVYLVTKTCLPLLLKSENGAKAVIAVSSMSVHFADDSISMGMSKFALSRFIEYLAAKYGGEGLSAYSLHPGGIPTRMSTKQGVVPDALQKSES